MKRFVQGMAALGLLLCCGLVAHAQVLVSPNVAIEEQQIDTAEINRRIAMGLNVQSLGGVQATDADAIGAVAAPPEDDTHKWFLSVVCKPNDYESERLKRDWKAASTGKGNNLKNLAVPGNTKASWSHFNFYDMADPYQAWREKRWTIKRFPAIIVQVPANGRYGPEGDIVCQFEGYSGDPEKLYKQLTSWVASRAVKYQQASYGAGKTEGIEGHKAEAEATEQCPLPYAPSPNIQPTGPVWVQPDLPPQVPTATPTASSEFSWANIILGILAFFGVGGTALATLIGLVLGGMAIWRTMRKATGKPTLVDDATYQAIRQELSDVRAALKAKAP